MIFLFSFRKKGRTIQLLKQSNKGKTIQRKRRKFDSLGSLSEFKCGIAGEEQQINSSSLVAP